MNYLIHKIVFTIIPRLIFFLLLFYLLFFGRAFRQNENHLNIAINLPRVILTSEPAAIDDKTYLAPNSISFIKATEKQGFTYLGQMGSTHFFTKDGKEYSSSSRMYSSRFVLFSFPTKTNN